MTDTALKEFFSEIPDVKKTYWFTMLKPDKKYYFHTQKQTEIAFEKATKKLTKLAKTNPDLELKISKGDSTATYTDNAPHGWYDVVYKEVRITNNITRFPRHLFIIFDNKAYKISCPYYKETKNKSWKIFTDSDLDSQIKNLVFRQQNKWTDIFVDSKAKKTKKLTELINNIDISENAYAEKIVRQSTLESYLGAFINQAESKKIKS